MNQRSNNQSDRKQRKDTAHAARPIRARLIVALLLLGIGLSFLGVRIYSRLSETPPPQLLTLGDDITFGSPPPLSENDLTAFQDSLARVRTLEIYVSSHPNDTQVRQSLALQAMQAGELLTAKKEFQIFLQMEHKPDPRAYESLALCETQLGLVAQSITAYQKLISYAPYYVRGYTGLSKAQEDMQQHSEGLQTLELGVRSVAPQDIMGRLEIISDFERRGDLPRALSEIQALQNIAPDDTNVIKAHAILLVKIGRLSEARPLLEKQVAAHPDDSAAKRWLAAAVNNAFLKKPDSALAEHLFLDILSHDRQDAQACQSLGQLYLQQNRFRQAACIYTWLLHVIPDSSPGRTQLARAYMHIGDKRNWAEQQAIADKLVLRDLEESRMIPRLNKRPADPNLHFILGRHYVSSGQFRKALPELQAAYCLSIGSKESRSALIELYARAGIPPPENVRGKFQ